MTEMEYMRFIGRNIKQLLDEYPMTQEELAEKIGVNKGTISRYINAERMPSVKNIVNIAYILECDITDIIEIYGKIS